ncbi:MAG: hypothetical protein DCC49_09155 [Acidobacteria bacterium]|nr:MAG: hypothetical protein DCC49_09155 [Acidobacteriota bacterium]
MAADGYLKAFGIGSTGSKVGDLHERLTDLGYSIAPPEFGREYGESTAAAVREFQQQSGLNTDGIVGSETWDALVAAGYRLGDRLLYLRSPMLRGDDVSELQSRLNSIGFGAGAVDGIFGEETAAALRDFQRNIGGTVDGVFGPETSEALRALGHKAAPVAAEPPAELLRVELGISGKRILLDPLGLGCELPRGHGPPQQPFAEEDRFSLLVAEELALELRARGATPLQSRAAGEELTPEERAAVANDAAVDAIVAVGHGSDEDPQVSGVACYYFAGASRESQSGRTLALLCHRHLLAATGSVDCRIHGRNWTILRLTRAPAVVVELGFLSNSDDLSCVDTAAGRRGVALALGRAIEEFFAGAQDPPAPGRSSR